jgi:hypothetical protein
MDAEALIRTLGLVPLGFEGGYYREMVRSEQTVRTPDGPRAQHTAIFYLLTDRTRSLMHRLRSDEVYHFYRGDPVSMLMLHPDGRSESLLLGPDVAAGQRIQHRVPKGAWQGSQVVPGGSFALLGTTMAPGFDLADFELGDRMALVEAYPEAAKAVRELTPDVVRAGGWEVVAAGLDLLHAERASRAALLAGVRARRWGLEGPSSQGPSVDDVLERLERDPTQRRWGRWYGIRTADRSLRATASFRPRSDGGWDLWWWCAETDDAPRFLRTVMDQALESGATALVWLHGPRPVTIPGYRETQPGSGAWVSATAPKE